MRYNLRLAPIPLLRLLTFSLSLSPIAHANPLLRDLQGLTWNQLFGRGECSNPCGWEDQLCCSTGEACYTDSSNQAQCSKTTAKVATTAVATTTNGQWVYYTSTYIETDTELVTKTSVYSSWCGTATSSAWAAATSTAAASCDWDSGESSCGSICCASTQYCLYSGQCAAAAVSSTSTEDCGCDESTSTAATGSAALRPTSSTLLIVTATTSPTTTVPFVAPVATGANVTLTSTTTHSHGLSGGAIAGIVIGVLAALFLLFLLLLFCCFRGIWHALFGGGGGRRRSRRTVEREEVIERRHHSSAGGAGGVSGGGRSTWYGSRPTRTTTERRSEKRGSGMNEVLGIGAALAGLAAVLGIKRDRDRERRREREKYATEYESSYGSYYTSESSASSDDRRTRDTRRSYSRSRTRR